GAPALVGLDRAELSVLVPACAADADLPLEAVLFGHGLFGSAEEYAQGSLLQRIADDHCVVVFATDWIGLSSRQLALAAFAVNDLNRAGALADMLGQSVVNFIALERLVRGE